MLTELDTRPQERQSRHRLGLVHTWWRGDSLPALEPLAGLTIEPADADAVIAKVAGLGVRETIRRERQGHCLFLARVAGEPVACGWSAAQAASIGEVGLAFEIPAGSRYLWDFVTLPAWRGRGIYPRLLHAIIYHTIEAERFWIGHDLANVASARGIGRAGFRVAGGLSQQQDGRLELIPTGPADRAAAAAALLGVPLANGDPRSRM